MGISKYLDLLLLISCFFVINFETTLMAYLNYYISKFFIICLFLKIKFFLSFMEIKRGKNKLNVNNVKSCRNKLKVNIEKNRHSQIS